MPMQLLAFSSSKQLQLLPGMHKQLLYVLFANLLMSSLVIFSYLVLKEGSLPLRVLGTVAASISLFVLSWIYVSSIRPGFEMIMLILLPVSIKSLEFLLPLATNLQIFSLLISIWLLFSAWWLRYRKIGLHSNIFGSNFSQLMRQNEISSPQASFVQKFFAGFLISSPRTLGGTLLLGAPDGWRTRLITTAIVAVGASGLWSAYTLSPDRVAEIIPTSGAFFVFMALYMHGYLLSSRIYNNLHKAWLYLDGDRLDLSAVIEKIYWARCMFWYPLVILTVALFEKVSHGMFLGDFPLMLIVAVSLSVQIFYFYACYLGSAKGSAALGERGLLDLGILVSALILATAISISWSHDRSTTILLLIGVCGALWMAAFVFRWLGRRSWHSVELAPVKL